MGKYCAKYSKQQLYMGFFC